MNLADAAYYSDEHGLYHNHCQAMGTRLDVILHGVERPSGDQAFKMIYSTVSELELILSRFDENSPISMINHLASKNAVVAGDDLFSILSMCKDYHERTSGLFDSGIGRVIAGIRNGNTEPDTIREMLEHSGMDNIILEPGNKSVRFLDDYVEIDLGGFGKGYALDRIKSRLISIGISDAFISFGDSSILALGNHPYGQGWKSGVNHLFKPGESLFAFDLMNESLSTSGTGPGKSRDHLAGHILHPVKGFLEPGLLHISVTSESAVDAEVLSTAMIAATEEEKGMLLERFPGCRAVQVTYDDAGNASVRELHNNN
jgi:thiamine biosynthesis lipoprotein